jgi:IclR family pca regulon transcriptional regulator
MGSMTEMGSDRDHIQSLERGFAVLLAFDEERPNPTLAELATVTGFSRPAVRRILLTLQRLGYVENSGVRWALTPRVLSIGQHYSASHSMTEIAQPHLVELAEKTSESASLATLDADEVVYIARVAVRRIMSINVSPGTRVPAHATSMGRVLLAWAPASQVERYLVSPGLTHRTPHTVTDPEQFRLALARVRRQGWALVSEELEAGLISVSAPVRDHTGTVVAALASSSSTGRTTPGHLERHTVPLAVATAEAISADLGYRGTTRTGTAPVSRDGFY